MPKPFKATFIDQEKKINLKEGIIPFILTSKVVDRDSEVILPKGGDVTEFKTNPVFLWAHDMWSPSIGKVLTDTIKVTPHKMTADVQFDLDDPFAALIFNKYAKGFLNAGSIRFRPTKIDERPVMQGQTGVTIKEWKLLEFSAVPIPANPEALAQIAKSGFELDDDKAKKWHEVLKGFYQESDEYEPEDFIDYLNEKAEEEEPEEIEKDDMTIKELMTGLDTTVQSLKADFELMWRITAQINGKNAIPFAVDCKFAYINWVTGEERFKHHDEDGKADWKSVAKSMIELFKDEDLKEDERVEVYHHLARHYKEFDHEPPELTGETVDLEEDEVDEIDNEDIQLIVDKVVNQIVGTQSTEDQ